MKLLHVLVRSFDTHQISLLALVISTHNCIEILLKQMAIIVSVQFILQYFLLLIVMKLFTIRI